MVSSLSPLSHRLLWTLTLSLAACATTSPTTQPPQRRAPALSCPWPPQAAAPAQQIRILRRHARELRANLTAQWADTNGNSKIRWVASLYPPSLALLVDAIQSPRKAREGDVTWLRAHLLRSWIDIRSAQPIGLLERGEVDRLRLWDQDGRRYPVSLVQRQKDGADLLYRLSISPIALSAGQGRLNLTIPLGADHAADAAATLSWVLSPHDLKTVDRLPLLFGLMPAQRLLQARWLALGGRPRAAQHLVDRVLECAPQSQAAQKLSGALRRSIEAKAAEALPAQTADPAADEPGAPSLPLVPARQTRCAELPAAAEAMPKKPGARQTATGPTPGSASPATGCAALSGPLSDQALATMGVALRHQLLATWTLSARQGLLSSTAFQALQRSLKTLRPGAPGLLDRLHTFDLGLHELLKEALSPMSGLHPPPNGPLGAITDAGAVPCAMVLRAKKLALLAALRAYGPRTWRRIESAASPRSAETVLSVGQDSSKGRIASVIRQRVPDGWIHPGLPPGAYHTTPLHRGRVYWRSRIPCMKSLDELKPAARAFIGISLRGESRRAYNLALWGLARLNDTTMLPAALNGAKNLPPARLAEVVTLVGGGRGETVQRFLQAALRHPHPLVRGAAITSLRSQASPNPSNPTLPPILQGSAPQVQRATLALRFSHGRGDAVDELRRWLGNDHHAAAAVSIIAHSINEPTSAARRSLSRPLLSLLRRKRHKGLAIATAKIVGRRAAGALIRYLSRIPSAGPSIAHYALGIRHRPLLKALLRAGVTSRRALAKVWEKALDPQNWLLEQLRADSDPAVRLLALAAEARLGDPAALMKLGPYSRASCDQAMIVLPVLSRRMDIVSRRRLFVHALGRGCDRLANLVWGLVIGLQRDDIALLRLGLSHRKYWLNTYAALTVLGLTATGPEVAR